MKALARVVVSLTLSIAVTVEPASAQAACSLSPIFALFRIVAGADIVRDCREPATIGENGDVSQATTKGMAVFRRADQVTAFTDGQVTWLWGPEGLQARPNGTRLTWEASPSELQPATVAGLPIFESTEQRRNAASRPPTPTPAPAPTANSDLAARCLRIVQEERAPLLRYLGPGSANAFVGAQEEWLQMCRESAAADGAAGVDCFGTVLHRKIEYVKMGTNPRRRLHAGRIPYVHRDGIRRRPARPAAVSRAGRVVHLPGHRQPVERRSAPWRTAPGTYATIEPVSRSCAEDVSCRFPIAASRSRASSPA